MNWYINNYGSILKINKYVEFTNSYNGEPLTIDIECDFDGNLVGIGLCWIPSVIYYFSQISADLKKVLESAKLCGHNIKFDARMLYSYNIDILANNLEHDTMLMAYSMSSSNGIYGLKQLAAKYLNMIYPSYKEMIGKGHNKIDLKNQPIEHVANYCACDVLATHLLKQKLFKLMTPIQRRIYYSLEIPIMQCLYDMELAGVTIDVEYLKTIKSILSDKCNNLANEIKNYAKSVDFKVKCNASCPKKPHNHEFNPNSTKQILLLLKHCGFDVNSTNKYDLSKYENNSFIQLVYKYRETQKLLTTYVEPYEVLPTLPQVHTYFNQVRKDTTHDEWYGIKTGRLSSSNPNLHNIPTEKIAIDEHGNSIRKLFIPRQGKRLICADYSQIEYRLLAHFSREKRLLDAYKNGKDIHEETAALLGCSRDIGKILNFASIYGADGKTISRIAKITKEEADKFLNAYWNNLLFVKKWINSTKYFARRYGYIKTLFGRIIEIPNINDINPFARFLAERSAVNYVIQGSASDIIKLAMIKCRKAGLLPILQVHDELLFEVDESSDIDSLVKQIATLMTNSFTLRVPLVVNIGVGKNWDEAKNNILH